MWPPLRSLGPIPTEPVHTTGKSRILVEPVVRRVGLEIVVAEERVDGDGGGSVSEVVVQLAQLSVRVGGRDNDMSGSRRFEKRSVDVFEEQIFVAVGGPKEDPLD